MATHPCIYPGGNDHPPLYLGGNCHLDPFVCREWPPTHSSRKRWPPFEGTYLHIDFLRKGWSLLPIWWGRDSHPLEKIFYPPTRLSKRRWPPTNLSRRMWPSLPTCSGEGGHQFAYLKNKSHLIIYFENIDVHIYPSSYPKGNGHPLFGSGGNGYPFPFI